MKKKAAPTPAQPDTTEEAQEFSLAEETLSPQDTPAPLRAQQPFPITGIGASAGGLEAAGFARHQGKSGYGLCDITVSKTLEAKLRLTQAGLEKRIGDQDILLEQSDAKLQADIQRGQSAMGGGIIPGFDEM